MKAEGANDGQDSVIKREQVKALQELDATAPRRAWAEKIRTDQRLQLSLWKAAIDMLSDITTADDPTKLEVRGILFRGILDYRLVEWEPPSRAH